MPKMVLHARATGVRAHVQVKALVPIHQYDKLPSYFIFAGLVFVPLTQPYLHEYGDDWYNASPRRLCERAMRSLPTQEGEQMVILSQVSSGLYAQGASAL